MIKQTIKYTPRQYQLEGRDFLRQRKYALLGDECGVGKTGQALLALEPHWRVLIVCPATVKEQWKEALNDWRGFNAYVVNSGSNTKGNRMNEHTRITIVNYDLMIRDRVIAALMQKKYDVVIFDEAHRLKSLGAKRTKIALGNKYLRPRASRIWFLTGTPVKNRTIDLYPILKTCAPEVLGKYDSYLKFAYRYCGAYKGRFGLVVCGASNTQELHQRMKSFMLRREKRDVLAELPPRVVSVIRLDCDAKARKIIEEEQEKTIEQAGENDPSLFQLGEQVRIRQALAKHKVPVSIDYIKDLLEQEEKIVVFYHHKEVLVELRRHLSAVPSVYIDGSVPAHRRRDIVAQFTRGEGARIFFGQMSACGEGVDGLQQGSHCCVFVEPSWSHTDIEQCIGRLERSGQRNDVNVYILVIKDTVEDRMMDVVAMKLKTDQKLYDLKTNNSYENQQGENTMGPIRKTATPTTAKQDVEETVKPVVNIAETLVLVLERLTTLCEILAPERSSYEQPIKQPIHTGDIGGLPQDPVPTPAARTKASKPVTVEAPQEEVTEEAVRARAGDICKLRADGTGKAKVVEIVKEICGGKISDLKTQENLQKAMAEFDNLYAELKAEDAENV